jgi:hypothetical protein
MPSTSSVSAAAVAVADGAASDAVADGGASVTVVVVAAASPAAGDVWSADAGAAADVVVPDVADARALSKYWMLRTFSPVEPSCSSGQVNVI